MEVMTFNIDKDRRNLVDDKQNFNIDFHDSKYNWLEARQYEDGMRQVEVHVVHGDGSPVDLTGVNPVFEGWLPEGSYRIIDAKHSVMIDAQNGIFRFDFPAPAFQIAGSYKQAFFCLMKDGKSVTTLEFSLDVMADKVISGLVPSDYITPFEDLYFKLKDYVAKANGDFDAAMDQWKKDVADLITELNTDVSGINLTITEIKAQLSALEDKIKADGLMTQADLEKALDGFTNQFAQLTSDTQKALGDFQDDNVLTGFFNDETIEVGGQIPSYYLERLNQFTTISADNFNVGFITDNHHQLSSYAPNSLAHYAYIAAASRRAPLQAIVSGGDNTNGWYTKTQKLTETRQATSTLFNRAKAGTDVYFVFGNHDNGIDQNGNNTPETCLSDAEIKAYYHTADKVYGETRDGDSLYGYKDYSDKKVRLIWLNSFDLPYTLNSDGTYKYDFLRQSGYQNQQLTWLANQALKVPDNSWQVMIFTHCPLPGTFEIAAGQPQLSQYNSDVLIGIINAFQSGTKYSLGDASRTLPINVTCDYTSQGKGVVIGLFSGHIHADGQMIYDGINCIETASSLCYSGDAGRVQNTETEDCWDIFSVDTAARKIHAYRFGFGTDRDFTY
ncbi:BppU family phage baseplate upper protein [Pediococcus acidilactici]|uniref:BppU family phage baseplate upper protein n=1 Tax=Pediococcus acidilactici TaxID=1254 RepID=UPI00237F97BE|nr:BppU family phage baseplate upper protein [Pediococcus acidilactici]WDV24859.1 BppU family phage baseplate upper protein [Pediococcus acidilactici]WEE13924.1 BppU family phage baseplate upper protein [Pediococcus acidilactici]